MDNMLNSAYENAINENSTNIGSYENYKTSHENLMRDLNTFRDTLEPKILVPVCNRVLMEGTLIHTNEVMVSLGCGYFTKCSVASAQDICKRRISKANECLKKFELEKEYLESQVRFKEENIFSRDLKEIIEPYDEEAETEWRRQHALRMKENRKQENAILRSMDHDDVMQKLELLELQEDIDRLYINQNKNSLNVNMDYHTNNEVQSIVSENTEPSNKTNVFLEPVEDIANVDKSRQSVLRKKLNELQQRRKKACKTEEDVFRRLEELEEEEEIEDELEKLGSDADEEEVENEEDDNETEIEECESDEEVSEDRSNSSGRRITFPKTDVEVQTININFKHSNNFPETKTQAEEMVSSPSDIYKMFPENFNKSGEIKGIIKNCHRVKEETHNRGALLDSHIDKSDTDRFPATTPSTVNIGDVVERSDTGTVVSSERPISKFKSMRMANKKK